MSKSKRIVAFVMSFLITGVLLGYTTNSATALKDPAPIPAEIPKTFSGLAEQARPAVVNIRTVKTVQGGGRVFRHFFRGPQDQTDPFRDFFGPFSNGQPPQDFKQRSLGSGFIIDREGYIVTNNHVIDAADQITVKLSNNKEYDAKLVGRDPKTDLALIKIKGASDLKPLPMGDSEKLKVGSWVVAIGSPFGLEQTVTAGIVSAKGRIIGSGPFDDFIQTDAFINPGNSGGPLINMNGEVIGINTAIAAGGQGIGFAIPMNLAKGIIDQLKSNGEVVRAWLGVGIQDLTPELAEYYGLKGKTGVLVTQVYKGDPADNAGIQPKDIIISVDGKPVDSSKDLLRIIANAHVGKKAAITLFRDGKNETVSAKLSKRTDSERLAQSEPEVAEPFGLSVAELTPENAHQYGYDKNEKGLLVTDIKPGSKADRAGIRKGDLIKETNRTPVDSLTTFQKEMERNADKLQLLVKRQDQGYLVFKIS
ncbi:MAG TPA: DegQ family serine endoprotease [Deltaproteobacteria bacterium]|nr:DegQ family serine endoprotease [Deltaproteobacteria bacterium]